MNQTSKRLEFNTPQPTGMQDAGVVRGVHFNKAVDDITALIAAVNPLVTNAGSFFIANVILANSTSTTTNFGSLVVGDRVLILPATAGNAQFVTCATAGTLPQSAVSGSLYVVLRANS
jgi:hypothetical protein